jgi:hypothetical protein
MRRWPLSASDLEAHVSRQQSRNRGATNIGVGLQDLWLPTLKPGPFKQGCTASLLEGTSLKKSKTHATVCGKPLISTGG